jgi:hypothetical protein
MISYGAIFHWGFLNFYLSVGFSLFALAIIVGGTCGELLLVPIFLALCALAHPMGAACLMFLGSYATALRWVPAKYHFAITASVVVVAFAARAYLVRHFGVLQREITAYWLLGADQLIVFGHRYLWFGVVILALCAVCILIALRTQPLAGISPWLQFYLAIALVVYAAPGGLFSDASLGMMGYLPDRGSLYSAVALATLVACCRPRMWFPICCGIVGVVFFVAIYRDTGLLDRRDARVAELVKQYTGRRIISMIPPIPGSRIHEDHSLDRACIGHCYSYNNYEPSTYQFQLRANPGNRVVMVDQDALDSIKDGDYVVKPSDVPLYEVYQCGWGVDALCIVELAAGMRNGAVPYLAEHP